MVRKRNRYGTGARSIRRAAIRGARRTSTQAGCIADVVRKINGTLTTGRQGSTRRSTHLRRNRRGLVDFTSSVLGGRTSTSRNLPGRDTIRRTVKWDLRATVYKHISRMKVALLVLISTYVWNQGQANPRVGDNKPLQNTSRIQTLQIPETRDNRISSAARSPLTQGSCVSSESVFQVDSQVISCQVTQVRLGSQMVEESLELSQDRLELTEGEFTIKEDGEMEASVSRISLTASCQLTQGSCVSSESVFLWENSLQHPFFGHASKSRLELGDYLQAGCPQGVSEEFEHGGEEDSLKHSIKRHR